MRFKSLSLVLLLMFLLLTECRYESVSSENISQAKSEYNIVSASVAATHILDALDLDIVGRPTTQNAIPDRYSNVEEVGLAHGPNFEKIISLNADIVVADEFFAEDFNKKAEQYGIEMLYISTFKYGEFLQSILNLGTRLDRVDNAKSLVEKLSKPLNEIENKYKNVVPPSVCIIFGSSESFMLATEQSYIGDLVKIVGGKNIIDNVGIDSSYVDFSMEQIIVKDPDIILRFSHGNIEATKESFDSKFSQDSAWNSLTAVKNGRVYDLDPAIFGVSANLNISTAIETLGKLLYEN